MITEDVLAKIAKLIERASHSATPEAERDLCLERADAMMVKYSIDRAFLESVKPAGTREAPTSVDIAFVPISDPFRYEMRELLRALAESSRVRVAFRGNWKESQAILVGFPSDIEYCRMLWTGVYFAFVSRVNPSWDTALTADQNIKILKESGKKWAQIAIEANAHGFECKPNDGRLKAAYRRACKAEGVEPTAHTQRHGAYRASFVEAFVYTVTARLRKQADAAAGIVRDNPGSELVLADRSVHVDAKFYDMFPDFRPMSDEERAELRRDREAAMAAEKARRASLTDEERKAEDRQRAKQTAAYAREYDREQARRYDEAGDSAGRRAGQSVDLGGAKVSGSARKGIQS